MKSCCLLCIIFIFGALLPAQDLLVSNVTFAQDKERVTINYDLGGAPGKEYNIVLSMSSATDAAFAHTPQAVAGDIGKVTPGADKEIIWTLTKDFPDGLKGDAFVFTITAQYKKITWPYYLLGGGALLGGVAYFAAQNGKTKAASAGSISINIPGDI